MVNSCAFNSATQLTANLTITSTATLGTRNVTVTNPDNQSGTLANGFLRHRSPRHFSDPEGLLQPSAHFQRNGHTYLPQATGAGHAIIVGLSFWPLDISSVTDGSADTFTRGLATSIFHNVSGSGMYTNFYYAKSTAGGTTSLTLKLQRRQHLSAGGRGGGGGTRSLCAAGSIRLPRIPHGHRRWSSAAVTTTAANEYLFSWAATEASNPACASPATGWVIESQTNDAGGATVCLLDRVVSATGSYQASATASTAQNYAMEMVTFK